MMEFVLLFASYFAIMNRKVESFEEDPYEVIRRLRSMVEEQKSQLEEYELVCDALTVEKGVAVREVAELKGKVDFLTSKIGQQQSQLK